MVACLGAQPGIISVGEAATPEQAFDAPTLAAADLVLLDVDVDAVAVTIAQLHQRSQGGVLAVTTHWSHPGASDAIDAGAVGVVCKDGLTAEALGVQVAAALHGAGVMPAPMLTRLAQASRDGVRHTRVPGVLTSREQRVLQLIADGKITREVARELAYSERTVKAVLRDAVVKLGARSRSQAVAHAVKEGLI